MKKSVYIVVRSMLMGADSIAYDVGFQYRLFKKLGFEPYVFVENFDFHQYINIPAQPIERFEYLAKYRKGIIIYHLVDNWEKISNLIIKLQLQVIIRWHNITPPWFFAPYSIRPTQTTIDGYAALLNLAYQTPVKFWVNSNFSKKQLEVLGIESQRINTIFPASHFVEFNDDHLADDRLKKNQLPISQKDMHIKLLFVGRIIPHKGHKHIVMVAHYIEKITNEKVKVYFPGPLDPDTLGYQQELKSLATQLDVNIHCPGIVSNEKLNEYYNKSDIFIMLSEHEGFGLPVIEAMIRKLPVVGYRNTALYELLINHPLGCDSLDYFDIAKKVIVAVKHKTLREEIITYQLKSIVPLVSKNVIENQIAKLLTNEKTELPIPNDMNTAYKSIRKDVRKYSKQIMSPKMTTLSLPRIDSQMHFVSQYDIDAYKTLINMSKGSLGTQAMTEENLVAQAMELNFVSSKPIIGKFIVFFKRAVQRLQLGIIHTISLSQANIICHINHKLNLIEEKINLITPHANKSTKKSIKK